jgi:hypothetical protein
MMLIAASSMPATYQISPQPGWVSAGSRKPSPIPTDDSNRARASPIRRLRRSVNADAARAPSRPVMLSTPIVLGERWISRTRNTIVTAFPVAWNSIVVAVVRASGRRRG